MMQRLGSDKLHKSARPSGRLRWLVRFLHRMIGHTLGIVFAIIGLTGSILAFWQTIDETLNRDMMLVHAPDPPGSMRAVDELLPAAMAVMLPGGLPRTLVMPRHSDAAVNFVYEVPLTGGITDTHEIFLNPYTAEPMGQRVIQENNSELSMPFIQIMMSLHSSLLLGFDYMFVVGFIGLALLTATFAGPYLWWPRNGNWRQAFSIKSGASIQRFLFDIHRVTGIWSCMFLVILLITGICVIFRPQVQGAVNLISAIQKDPETYKSAGQPGAPVISAGTAARIAEAALPGGDLYSIALPQKADDAYIVGRQSSDEPNRAGTYRNVVVDQYSGKVLAIQDRARFSAGETFNEWLYPIHCGEAFGNTGRSIVFVLGLVPIILYLSGLARWRHRRRASRP